LDPSETRDSVAFESSEKVRVRRSARERRLRVSVPPPALSAIEPGSESVEPLRERFSK
jgi:hypothetical protein